MSLVNNRIDAEYGKSITLIVVTAVLVLGGLCFAAWSGKLNSFDTAKSVAKQVLVKNKHDSLAIGTLIVMLYVSLMLISDGVFQAMSGDLDEESNLPTELRVASGINLTVGVVLGLLFLAGMIMSMQVETSESSSRSFDALSSLFGRRKKRRKY